MGRYSLWALINHNFKEGIRTRWLIIFSIVFFFLAINIPTLVLLSASYLPPNYLEVYLSYLVSLSFPYLPLLALPIGATSIVHERESRSMEYVLSTRLTRHGFITAKVIGLTMATTAVIVLGYGVATLLVYRVSAVHYVAMLEVIAIAAALNCMMLFLALLVSLLTRRRETAMGMAIFLWFLFSVISSLGQLALLLDLKRYSDFMAFITLLDPVESTRILAVITTNPVPSLLLTNPTQLGVTGLTMLATFGDSTGPVITISVVVWIAILLGLCFLIFRRQDIN
jgi:Cu-processing system permease protein